MLKLISANELANRWGLAPRTLESWRSRGRGPAYLKIGGKVHYRQDDIEAYEAECRQERKQ